MRFGFNCIVTLLELQGRRVEVVFPNETNERLTLSDRVFVCEACGQTMDRDLNAAIPLKHTVSSTEMNACGEPVRPGDIAQAVVGEAGTWQQAAPGELFV